MSAKQTDTLGKSVQMGYKSPHRVIILTTTKINNYFNEENKMALRPSTDREYTSKHEREELKNDQSL